MRYFKLFRNDTALNESVVANLSPKLVAMATVLKGSEKEGRIDHLRSNTYYLIKNREIGKVDPEIIGIQEISRNNKKKLMQAKHIARRTNMAGGLNY